MSTDAVSHSDSSVSGRMPEVRFGSDDFRRAVEDLAAANGEALNACVLFTGAANETRQEALAAIADYFSLNIHQLDAGTLIGERPLQTQGNFREAFDNASEGASILFFEHAGALFADARKLREEDGLDADAHTPLEYFYQRVDAFKGVVVLRLQEPAHVREACRHRADLVVTW